jgi:hypothetical protein
MKLLLSAPFRFHQNEAAPCGSGSLSTKITLLLAAPAPFRPKWRCSLRLRLRCHQNDAAPCGSGSVATKMTLLLAAPAPLPPKWRCSLRLRVQ